MWLSTELRDFIPSRSLLPELRSSAPESLSLSCDDGGNDADPPSNEVSRRGEAAELEGGGPMSPRQPTGSVMMAVVGGGGPPPATAGLVDPIPTVRLVAA